MLSERQKDVIRQAMANKDEAEAIILELDKISAAGSVAVIADPGTATAEDVANKVNELIAALS